MIDLGKWLQQGLARGREACSWDCCGFPAAWAMANGTADPMAKYRGYTSEAEAEDIVARAGGLVGIFGAGLEGVGLYAVDEPRAGDIGVISLLGQEAGAIYTGRRWAFVAERGLGFVSLDREAISGIWRLPPRG